MNDNALARLSQTDTFKVLRHQQAGDWADLWDDDRRENELSLQKGFRLLSVYHGENGTKFYVITEADRSVHRAPPRGLLTPDPTVPGRVLFFNASHQRPAEKRREATLLSGLLHVKVGGRFS